MHDARDASRYQNMHMYWWWFVRDFYRLGESMNNAAAEVPAPVDLSPLPLKEVLKRTRAALELGQREQSAFSSGMHHELRTPLNAILGFAEMMKTETFGPLGNPAYASYATHIHDSGRELLAKIDDLIDTASTARTQKKKKRA